jgi:uncharacterized phiE125 gp8 family phage protein
MVSSEPVSLAVAKALMRIDGDALDADLELALAAARGEAEHYVGRSFAPQAWTLIRDDWFGPALPLPMGPVDSVDSITYLDPAGDWQTLPTDAYSLDTSILFLSPGYSLPRLLGRDHSVKIEFSTGTWDNGLPDDIVRAIAMLAQSTFDSLSEQPETLRARAWSLLRPYRFATGLRAA